MLRIACVSQKGGVGKSTLARDIAVQFAVNGWNVRIADMDLKQTTSFDWAARRKELGHTPEIHVLGCGDAPTALGVGGCDAVVIDGKPSSDVETGKISVASDFIVIPVGPSRDDLIPQVKMAYELSLLRIPKNRILFVLNGTMDLDGTEVRNAKVFISQAGYNLSEHILMRRSAYSQAQNIGKSISEVSHRSLRVPPLGVVTEINAMMKEVKAA